MDVLCCTYDGCNNEITYRLGSADFSMKAHWEEMYGSPKQFNNSKFSSVHQKPYSMLHNIRHGNKVCPMDETLTNDNNGNTSCQNIGEATVDIIDDDGTVIGAMKLEVRFLKSARYIINHLLFVYLLSIVGNDGLQSILS